MFDWSEFFDIAKALQDSGGEYASQEACSRCSISRAYYAAFRMAKNFLGKKNSKLTFFDSGRDHSFVQEQLARPGGGWNEVSTLLGRLHHERGRADYDDTFAAAKPQADICLTWSKKVLDKLNALP